MRKFVLFPVLLFVFCLCFVPNAYAARAVPALNCGSPCTSYWYFNHASGITGGSQQVFSQVVPPNLNNCVYVQVCVWDFYLFVSGSPNKWNRDSIIIGMEEATQGGGLCGGYSGTLQWFTEAYDDSGYNYDGTCTPDTYRGPVTMFVGPFVSDGGGMQAVIKNANTVFFKWDYYYSEGTPSSWQNIDSYEVYLNNLNTGSSDEPAQAFGYYQYYKNGNWNFQSGNQSGGNSADPPQWYWTSFPNQGNGGSAIHCLEISGPTCP